MSFQKYLQKKLNEGMFDFLKKPNRRPDDDEYALASQVIRNEPELGDEYEISGIGVNSRNGDIHIAINEKGGSGEDVAEAIITSQGEIKELNWISYDYEVDDEQ